MSKIEISRTLKRINTIKKILTTKGKGGSSKAVFTSLMALKDHVFYFQEIEKEKVSNKKIVSSNLLVNVFTANYAGLPVFVVDFKFAKLSRSDVDSLTKCIPKKDAEYNEFILKKVGFHDGEVAISLVMLAHLTFDRDSASYEKVEALLDEAWAYLNSDNQAKDGNYAYVLRKCAPSFAYFQRPMEAQALRDVAREVNEGYR